MNHTYIQTNYSFSLQLRHDPLLLNMQSYIDSDANFIPLHAVIKQSYFDVYFPLDHIFNHPNKPNMAAVSVGTNYTFIFKLNHSSSSVLTCHHVNTCRAKKILLRYYAWDLKDYTLLEPASRHQQHIWTSPWQPPILTSLPLFPVRSCMNARKETSRCQATPTEVHSVSGFVHIAIFLLFTMSWEFSSSSTWPLNSVSNFFLLPALYLMPP